MGLFNQYVTFLQKVQSESQRTVNDFHRIVQATKILGNEAVKRVEIFPYATIVESMAELVKEFGEFLENVKEKKIVAVNLNIKYAACSIYFCFESEEAKNKFH